MINWEERLATGSDTIDGQHKMLILHINQLEGMLKNFKPDARHIEFAQSLVAFLEQYAATHFKYEEQCMECHLCPAHEQNREQHSQFIEFFGRFHAKYQVEGFSLESFQALHQMTSSWIVSHILRIDTQLKPYVKN